MSCNVLIVDDAAFMRTSLRIILEKNGFTVVGEADNGEAAVKKYLELAPDIVTMDITMPKMDGIKALKGIMRQFPSANVVIVSSLGQENLVREAVICGAKGFILKPFKEDHLVATLKRVCGIK